jgi:hypothetical protein
LKKEKRAAELALQIKKNLLIKMRKKETSCRVKFGKTKSFQIKQKNSTSRKNLD